MSTKPWIDKDGYLIIDIRQLNGKLKHVREHRLVMEVYLNRDLLPEEDIHHLDGNKKNNKITNLKLCKSRSEHLKLYHSVHSEESNLKRSLTEKGVKKSVEHTEKLKKHLDKVRQKGLEKSWEMRKENPQHWVDLANERKRDNKGRFERSLN